MILSDLIPMAQAHPPFGRAKVVASIVDKRGNPLAFGFNQPKSHPLQAHFAQRNGNKDAIFLHAESDCIRNLLTKYPVKELNKQKIKLLVCRVYKNGNPAPAKPCRICQSLIDWAGFINEIKYTNGEINL